MNHMHDAINDIPYWKLNWMPHLIPRRRKHVATKMMILSQLEMELHVIMFISQSGKPVSHIWQPCWLGNSPNGLIQFHLHYYPFSYQNLNLTICLCCLKYAIFVFSQFFSCYIFRRVKVHTSDNFQATGSYEVVVWYSEHAVKIFWYSNHFCG